MRLKADFSSASHSSELIKEGLCSIRASDEGLTLEALAFNLFRVANLPCQLT